MSDTPDDPQARIDVLLDSLGAAWEESEPAPWDWVFELATRYHELELAITGRAVVAEEKLEQIRKIVPGTAELADDVDQVVAHRDLLVHVVSATANNMARWADRLKEKGDETGATTVGMAVAALRTAELGFQE